ncbi:MAG: PorT family protein [Flavobacterium sp.]|nr:PorT family protein [Flavobacterium sp.]
MMKKIFLCFLIIGFSANAQMVVKPGLRTGLNMTSISNVDADFRTDFYVGGFVALDFKSIYTLQPELTYSRQGAKVQYTSLTDGPDPVVNFESREADLEMQYLSLAIINKFNLTKNFHLLVGPSFDLKIGDNTMGDISGGDVAFHGGFGYDFPAGFGIEVRYKQGLSDVFGKHYYYDDYETVSNNDIKLNQVIQIGATYKF